MAMKRYIKNTNKLKKEKTVMSNKDDFKEYEQYKMISDEKHNHTIVKGTGNCGGQKTISYNH